MAIETDVDQDTTFPLNLRVVQRWRPLSIQAPVTFFVGENGTGKSTILEGLAAAAELPTISRDSITDDQSLVSARVLAQRMRLSWQRRTRRGFFLRAEDFFGFVQRIAALRREMQAELERVEIEYAGKSKFAYDQARAAALGSLAGLQKRYGADLDAFSHGESFLQLFRSRLVPQGLYLLDEPETPLSPQNQLALLLLIHETVQQGGQFIIATHSPIITAYPDAVIYSFDAVPVERVEYDELEQVRFLRSFLRDPGEYIHHLLTDG